MVNKFTYGPDDLWQPHNSWGCDHVKVSIYLGLHSLSTSSSLYKFAVKKKRA